MKYNIYFFEGNLQDEEVSKALTLEALATYCQNCGIDFDPDKAIFSKNEKGKPYIENLPVHYNVSHSANMWMAMVGPAPCGIDLQVLKECDYEKIAARHFTPEEQNYVRLWGIDGFFRIWTRREAYGKYTGQGFFGEMPAFVTEEGEITAKAGDAYLKEIEIADDIFCVYCTGGHEDEVEFFG